MLQGINITLKTTCTADPVTFLLATKEGTTPEHDCLQTIEEVYSSWLDLKDSLTENPDWRLHADRSSFVCSGKHMSGYVVTTQSQVIESEVLMSDVFSTEAQTSCSHLGIETEWTEESKYLDGF